MDWREWDSLREWQVRKSVHSDLETLSDTLPGCEFRGQSTVYIQLRPMLNNMQKPLLYWNYLFYSVKPLIGSSSACPTNKDGLLKFGLNLKPSLGLIICFCLTYSYSGNYKWEVSFLFRCTFVASTFNLIKPWHPPFSIMSFYRVVAQALHLWLQNSICEWSQALFFQKRRCCQTSKEIHFALGKNIFYWGQNQ